MEELLQVFESDMGRAVQVKKDIETLSAYIASLESSRGAGGSPLFLFLVPVLVLALVRDPHT